MKWWRVRGGLGGLLLAAACGGANERAAKPRPIAPGTTPPSTAVAPPHSADAVVDSVAAPRASRDPRIARLMRLAEIWGEIRFRHPYVFERAIDLDGALTAAIPAVAEARDEEAEAAAIGAMLAVLKDPQTRVDTLETAPAALTPSTASTSRLERGVVVVSVASPPRWGDIAAEVKRVTALIGNAKSVVLDLRAVGDDGAFGMEGVLEGLAPKLVSHEISPPAVRAIQHEGFTPERGTTSGGFRTYYATTAVRSYRPSAERHPARVAFIVDKEIGVPDLVAAMQRSGDAVVVSHGAAGDVQPTTPIWIGEHHVARLRRVESVDGDFKEDARAGATGDPIALAITTLAGVRPPRKPRPLPVEARTVEDSPYRDEALPSREHRLLGAFRLWSAIRLFYPYLALLDAPWDDAFEEAIPSFERASTPLEYAQAVAAFAAHIPDAHVWVQSKVLSEWFGTGSIHVDAQRLDGLPVVTRVVPGDADGLEVGDVLLDIDGVSFDARGARVAPYLAASNPWTRVRSVDDVALWCKRDAMLTVRVRDPKDVIRTLHVKCGGWKPIETTEPPFKRIDAAIGFVDLSRLQKSDVDAMFFALSETKAIVFDGRGYPNGTGMPLTRHLNLHDSPIIGSRVERPLLGDGSSRQTFLDFLPNADASTKRYRGKTVMLIDEHTQSQAEHIGLFFEAANGTRFIGSPSAGANGDITGVNLPGDIYVPFTGNDVRHADGRQLQRVGLKPDVFVRPTLQGIRAGRDEVLERALEDVRAQIR